MPAERLSGRVRESIREIAKEQSMLKISTATGIPYSSIHRFLKEDAGVRSDTLDQLAEFAELWDPQTGRWIGA